MQTSLHTVVNNIFRKNNLQEVSEQQLQDFVHSFPYSSIGHVLLAKKKQEEGLDYSKEAAIAAIYVNDPLWLHCFLHNEELLSKENIQANVQVTSVVVVEEIEDTWLESPEAAESIPGSTQEQSSVNLVEEYSVVIEVSEPRNENNGFDSSTEPPIAFTQPGEEIVENKIGSQTVREEAGEKSMDEKEPIFEPYYTIDYFASQGIKLKAGDLGDDKFGRQLKSFTEWLRSMKKVTPAQVDDIPQDNFSDEAIQKNAEESVEISDVETEAMAEVWAKQGKVGRAAAIYRKLSLLNPAKSHYFAAKIEQLNA